MHLNPCIETVNSSHMRFPVNECRLLLLLLTACLILRDIFYHNSKKETFQQPIFWRHPFTKIHLRSTLLFIALMFSSQKLDESEFWNTQHTSAAASLVSDIFVFFLHVRCKTKLRP
jgi:tellurite resistance protein TehA-like permease